MVIDRASAPSTSSAAVRHDGVHRENKADEKG